MKYLNPQDTICAIATGSDMSAIAMIRISGEEAILIVDAIFTKDLNQSKSHTIHFGNIQYQDEVIDEVLISVFKHNTSFTGEESVEISCHGSTFIQNRIIELLIEKGCRLSAPGEFTMRAFKNGKIDLSQAESIADLIASETSASHRIAMKNLKGGISNDLHKLREELINFGSLIELELDFSEEDVQFADRKEFLLLLINIKKKLTNLITSFKIGNAIKNGIQVAILGSTNVGKSTLINTLLKEERSIVSNIAGTTRDAIEDSLVIDGLNFRFIDTAGIRKSNNKIERIGIKKSFEKAYDSTIILFLIDATRNIKEQLKEANNLKKKKDQSILLVINKSDIIKDRMNNLTDKHILISAKTGDGIEDLKKSVVNIVRELGISNNETIVTNLRHYEQLKYTLNEIELIKKGMNEDISVDLLSTHIRAALNHMGLITGEITNDDLLGNIFSKFCIGK